MAGQIRISRQAVMLVTSALLLLGAITPALAVPDVTAAQAAALERQVRETIAGVLGPLAQLPDRPIQITAAGDHYDIVVPMAAEALDGSGKARITGIARPLDGGSWAVDTIKVSAPIRFTANLPAVEQNGRRHTPEQVVYTLDIQGQDGRVIWDPSFTNASSWTATTTATTLHAEGTTLSQDSKLGPSSSTTTLKPSGADRVDVLVDGTLQDYEIDSLVNDVPMHVGLQRVNLHSTLNGVSRSRAFALAQILKGLIGDVLGSPAGTAVKPAEVARAVLAAMQDFASDYSLDESIDGFAIKLQDQAFGMEQIKVGLAAKSNQGLLEAGIEAGMTGLALPDLPLGPLEAFIPRQIAFHPTISGLGVAELSRLIQSAADGAEPSPRDISALFSHGGIGAALESMTVELAGAVFHGHAKLLMTGPSPDSIGGTAQISAENFDQLVQKVSATAEAAQALPVLVLAKGAGRQSGNRLVWDVSYRNGKLMVNDVDLTAIMGGPAQSSPAPRADTRAGTPGSGGTEGAAKNRTPRPTSPRQVPAWGK